MLGVCFTLPRPLFSFILGQEKGSGQVNSMVVIIQNSHAEKILV